LPESPILQHSMRLLTKRILELPIKCPFTYVLLRSIDLLGLSLKACGRWTCRPIT
jgi:hypothetical protein